MGARIRRQIAESRSEKRIKEFVIGKLAEVHQALKDAGLYYQGANEQLMLQQGQAMTVQAGMIEWMDQHLGKPGFVPSDQIKAICEANIARAKAEREAKKAAEDAEKPKPVLAAVPDEIDNLNGSDNERNAIPDGFASPADIAPASPADAAPADTQGTA